MAIHGLRRTAARPAASATDDRGSIVMAMLLIMIATMLAGLLVPLLVAQARTTSTDYRREQSLTAAEAGLDVAVGRIRAANNGSGAGVLAALPCNMVSGKVSTAGFAHYQARIYYFFQDPQGHDDWINQPSKQLPCLSGTGLGKTPGYALIVSQGSNSSDGSFNSNATRTVEATYVFKTANDHAPGGLIHSFQSSPDLCLDAGSSSPAPGTVVTLQACASGADQQLWSFNDNLTISLQSTTDDDAGVLGLCLDAPYPHFAGEPMTLQNCSSTTSTEQQWSFNPSSNFVATTSTSAQDGYCWNPASNNTPGANLTLGGCGGRDNTHAFIPEAAVGAGNAGKSQKFLVDYNQFGRCLDVTNETLPSAPGVAYLIAYPCKVTPDQNKPPSNQQWNFPDPGTGASATGKITSVENSSYCLTSPLSLNGYPTMTLCDASLGASQTWTVWGDTGNYTTSYRITDNTTVAGSSTGYCLQPTDPTLTPPDLYPGDNASSKIIITTCSGATLQKWDAPPGVLPVPVKDYHEK